MFNTLVIPAKTHLSFPRLCVAEALAKAQGGNLFKAEKYYLISNCQHLSFRLWRDKYLPSKEEFMCHSHDYVSLKL